VNILSSDAQALVNTVNTVGVMGKGLALAFKNHYPDMYDSYRYRCRTGSVQIGKMDVHITDGKFIINFPTKEHWRNPTQIEWVEDGLIDLRQTIIELKIESIAIPPLGCGLGGLDWLDVFPLILSSLAGANVDLEIYQPNPLPRYDIHV
jgi:O-acetyl-ADP-ribose deacetylase (regulator of RNase III)